MEKGKNWLFLMVGCLVSALWLLSYGGCSGRYSGRAKARSGAAQTLSIRGSDTMVVLVQHWAEIFMQQHPNIGIQVSGGGSGTGFAALLNGTADIASASRPIKDKERALVRQTYHQEISEYAVAIDALAIYVHPQNPLDHLSLPHLKAIFRGKLRNWRWVGGENERIVLYSRENNSGTYEYFKEQVLDDEDFAAETQTLPGTAAVIHAVQRDRRGIGYGGLAYAQGVKNLALVNEAGHIVRPTRDEALAEKYPLARKLFFYTVRSNQQAVRAFLEWIYTKEAQALVEKTGFFAVALR